MDNARPKGKGESIQTRIVPWANKNLFSDHFLKKILPERVEGWEKEKRIREVFEEIKRKYSEEKELLESYNEAQLEEHFIIPIIKILGHHYEVQERTYKTRKQPDYAFFPDEESRRESHSNKGEKSFYRKAIGVGDAKAWEKSLDKKLGKGAAFEDQNPSFQIDTYLRETAPEWAILTNGRRWRIYYQETSYRMDSYFEVDLVDIVSKDDLESFKYFYFIFRLEALLPDETGKNFLNKVYEGSLDYAKELGEDLQENVYRALKILAEGFLDLKENELKKKPETIKVIHDNSLVFLYRLLFILYAESRGLLDLSNETYNKNFSLNSIKHEIAEKIDKGADFTKWRKYHWDRLQELFSLINEGSESKGIPKKDLFIPPYNGGLFDPSKHEFLEKKEVGDLHIAKVIDLLSRSNGGFIDYSSLDIRDLGSIYEGLLEFKLKVAEEDMVSIKKRGREVWIPRKKAGKKKIRDEVKEGELYLLTDKGERKATGSYYTPEYIVKYIVKNTLSPIVEQKRKEAQQNDQKESDALLSINVLDPAMGSGHFLVEAVDFLTEPFLDAINNDVEKGLTPEAEYDPERAKRKIVSHCIYGVDLNPLAVELAKLSLWLKTIAKNKPLSFLDHRLKCGNSLIGSNLEDLPWHPRKKEKNKEQERLDISGFTKKLVDTTKKLTEISDDTLDNIRRKEEIFSEFKKTLEYDMMKTLADLRTSIYFGNEVDEDTYGNYSGDAFFSTKKDWWKKKERDFAQKGTELAEEKRFFHWELEFPEVFYEKGKPKENPGFDVVIGNPPYGAELSKQDRNFLPEKFNTSKAYTNTGLQFIELCEILTKKNGGYGQIVPKPLSYSQKWSVGRNLILPHLKLAIDVSRAFEDVLYEQIIFVVNKRTKPKQYLTARGDEGGFESTVEVKKNFCENSDSLILNTKEKHLDIFQKITGGKNLGEISKTSRGLPYQRHRTDSGPHPVYGGKHIDRYHLKATDEYLKSEVVDEEKEKIQFVQQPKVISQRIVAHVTSPIDRIIIMSTLDKGGKLTLDTIENTILTNDEYDLEFVTALLNSSLFSWFGYEFIFSKAIRTMDFDNYYVSKFPLPDSDLIGKDSSQNYSILLECVNRINSLKEKKAKEKNGFLKWLSRKWNVDIEKLSRKTYLKEYWKYDFDEDQKSILNIAKHNSSKIDDDPSSRKFQEKLEKEWQASVGKLRPLMKEIQDLENQIDALVFKLYDLDEDEIKVVLDSLGIEKEVKQDILEKFGEL